MFGESYDYPIRGRKTCSKTPHVVIESFRGNARIRGTNGAVKVTGHKTVRSIDQDGADGPTAKLRWSWTATLER